MIDACEAEGVERYIASDSLLITPNSNFANYQGNVKEDTETKNVKGVHVLIGVFVETFWNQFLTLGRVTNTLCLLGIGDEDWKSITFANATEFVTQVAPNKEAVGIKRGMFLDPSPKAAHDLT